MFEGIKKATLHFLHAYTLSEIALSRGCFARTAKQRRWQASCICRSNATFICQICIYSSKSYTKPPQNIPKFPKRTTYNYAFSVSHLKVCSLRVGIYFVHFKFYLFWASSQDGNIGWPGSPLHTTTSNLQLQYRTTISQEDQKSSWMEVWQLWDWSNHTHAGW